MAVEGGQNKKLSGKGFAGLDSLLSKVDETVSTTAADSPARSSDSGARAKTSRPARPRTTARQADPRTEPQPTIAGPAAHPGPSGGKRLLKWGGIAFVVYVLWQGYLSNNPTRRQYSPPPAGTGTIAEEKPPVGTGRMLTTAQIRYCVSEKIRMEGADKALNTYVERDVNRFNAMVQDYNSRCGDFRYRRGTLESVKSEAERRRYTLEAEGRRRF